MQINADVRLRDLLREHPETGKVISRYGMTCASCQGVESETLKKAAENYGLPLERFLAELKAAVKSGS